MFEICRYAYSEIVQLNHSNMLDILMAASKLQMKFLTEKAIDFICKDGINDHTVFKILEANSKDNNMRISMKCFDYIQKSHKTVFKSSDFQSISSDMLRAMLQTCKVPKLSAKEAVAFWSAYPDNGAEDLDELIALITLMDDVEEINNNVPQQNRSDAGSTASSPGGSGNQGRNRRNGRQQGNQPDFRHQQPPGNFSNHGNGNRNQQPPGNFNNQSNGNRNQQNFQLQQNFQQQQFLQKQRQQATLLGNNFSLQGRSIRKHYTFANLDLMVMGLPIFITEIHFIYDLSSTDKDFELRILDVSAEQKTPIFYSNVSTSAKTNGEFTRYVLQRPCHVDSGTKIWISIDFKRGEHRLSLENYVVSKESTKDRLILRGDTKSFSSGQIISNIIFKDC